MRSYTFRNSKGSYRGIPIIAANMDTVGTFEMALALHQVSYALHGMCMNHLLFHKELYRAHRVIYHFLLYSLGVS